MPDSIVCFKILDFFSIQSEAIRKSATSSYMQDSENSGLFLKKESLLNILLLELISTTRMPDVFQSAERKIG